MFVLVSLNYGQLPDRIPTHFNGSGVVDGYGSKLMIWLLPIIALASYVVIRFASSIGKSGSIEKMRRMNTGFKHKSDEAVRRISEYNSHQAQWINLLTILLFSYILYNSLEIAKGNQAQLNPWVLWGLVAAIMVPCFKMVLFQLKTK